MSQSRTLLAVVVAATMTLALGIPVAADLNLVPGESAHVAYTNGDGINVRDYAGFSGSIITTLHEGVAVTVVDGPMWLDDGSAWFHIAADTYDGYIEGWVVADYLSGEYVEPDANRSTSDVGASAAQGTTATVVGTEGYGLRLRDGASTEAATLTVMPDGATVDVFATDIYDASGGSWAQLSWSGMTGFAASAYLSIGAGAAPAEPVVDEPETSGGLAIGDRASVVGTGGGGLNLRSEASYSAGVVTIVAEATVVTVLDGPVWDGAGNGWYLIDYSSMTGWVHGGYLAWSDQAPTSDPTLGSVEEPVAEEPAPVTDEPVAVEEPEPEPVAPETGIGAIVISEALNYVGIPYVWGGTTPSGFDCSGFTYFIFNKAAGVDLSRSLEVQSSSGSYVSAENLRPGDLVFQQNTYKWGLSHVGIYIGGGQMVNAQSERVGVAIADLWDSYWGPRYYTARRVV